MNKSNGTDGGEQQHAAIEEKIMERIDKDIERLRMRASMHLELESAKVNSTFADQKSLCTVLDALAN